jgi:cobalt-zinc-cadmium efflux system membrane fusion protein
MSSAPDARRPSEKIPYLIALLALIGGPAIGWFVANRKPAEPPAGVAAVRDAVPVSGNASSEKLASTDQPAEVESDPGVIRYAKEDLATLSIQEQGVDSGPLPQRLQLTGKIMLNEDRIAHVFPLVEGRVDHVDVHLGDRVKEGQLLVVVQSREVGDQKLQLYSDRLQREFVLTKEKWQRSIAENTYQLISLIREGAPMERIESQLTNRSIGQYRDTLMSAYIANYKAQKQYERLSPLSKDGIVTGKQLLESEAELNATRATLQSVLEQVSQDVLQASTLSAQAVKEIETRVAVGETNLKILGFPVDEIATIDPKTQGQAVSHYPVFAPFDGTIVSKDVVLLERVATDRQILSIADLSTVWVTIDAYEEHLATIRGIPESKLTLKSEAWPGKTFDAKVFYAGDMVDQATRTLSMRAIADNADGMLKPGMFVTVELPLSTDVTYTRVPLAALQQHEGKTFVFVREGEETFRRRDVVLGTRNEEFAEVKEGLKPGEKVVTSGGFALKSRMLAELMGEE